ncbi:glutamine synthetase, partial [Candidatus Peregrinibacteria bacterium RIFOXYB2_FULL_32_7]
LTLTYEELQQKNLKIKHACEKDIFTKKFEEELKSEIKNEAGIKSILVAFSSLEGKLHLLDYSKDFLFSSEDNLTFDGSSISGFANLDKSDLRLLIDWSTLRFLPADVFGAGKVLVFANIHNQDGQLFESDFRNQLIKLTTDLKKKKGLKVNMAPEIEGILFNGIDAEQNYDSRKGFELVTKGGYFNTLPKDELRIFIDKVAETKKALGFENEKDHPEVAPSSFELNYKYCEIVRACDQVLIFKLVCRLVAKSMGYTASFLPKPMTGINGNGMHSNISLAQNGKNIFYDKKGEFNLSQTAHRFAKGIMYYAKDICLTFCPSVNSYRRLDPNFEAPNEIKMSPTNRSVMIRVPFGNERSARIEVRSVSPDCNPYLASFALLSAGLKMMNSSDKDVKEIDSELQKRGKSILPSTIYEAIDYFQQSSFVESVLGKENKSKYLKIKQIAAKRSSQNLGTIIKSSEILFHHEVTNQYLWSRF